MYSVGGDGFVLVGMVKMYCVGLRDWGDLFLWDRLVSWFFPLQLETDVGCGGVSAATVAAGREARSYWLFCSMA